MTLAKPILEKITYVGECSFAFREDILPHIKIPLHFHPEYELTFIIESYGKRFIGDNIENFESGDLIFIGPNLPHFWLNNKLFYHDNNENRVRLLVIHFREDFLGRDFFNAPEMHHIRKFLSLSQRGIKITGETAYFVKEQMIKMGRNKSFVRLMILLNLLDKLAISNECYTLASEGYKNSINLQDADRISKIYEFIVDHFAENINLEDVSSHVNMSPPSFCRYLRNRLGKPFKQMLNEIRIGHACKELLETDNTIASIAYESGYNNLSNFNRRFREVKKISPAEYKRTYKALSQ